MLSLSLWLVWHAGAVAVVPPALSPTSSLTNYRYLSSLLAASDLEFSALVDPKAQAVAGNVFQAKADWWKPFTPNGATYPDLGPTMGRPLVVKRRYVVALPKGAWEYVDEIPVGSKPDAEAAASRLHDALADTFKSWNVAEAGPVDHNVEPRFQWNDPSGAYSYAIAASQPELKSGWVVLLELTRWRKGGSSN